jgi:hypothetical protein
MKKQSIVIGTSLAIALGLSLSGAASAQFGNLEELERQVQKPTSDRSPGSILSELTGDSKSTRADAGCSPSKKDSGTTKKKKGGVLAGLGFEDPKQAAFNLAMDEAAAKLNLGSDVELPAQIEDTCQATKRLSYVEKRTGHWSASVIDSIQQAKAALALSGEAASYAAFRNNPDFSAVESKQITQLRDDIRSDLSAIELAIAEKRKANQEMLAIAGANMRSALAQGTLIGTWDKRLIEFLGDNSRWAIKEHLNDVKLFTSHVELLGGTLSSMQSVLKAQEAAGGKPSAATLRKAEAESKQREKENDEFERKLLAELQL